MGRLKKWLDRAPIPAAFMICGIGSLIAALMLTKATLSASHLGMQALVMKYETAQMADVKEVDLDKESVRYFTSSSIYDSEIQQGSIMVVDGDGYDVQVMRLETPNWTISDINKFNIFSHMDEAAAVLWYTLCLGAAAFIFYRWKIKRPYRALTEAVWNISQNNLDFEIGFKGTDELGGLCRAVDIMRRELARGNRQMWETMEERKRLNAAFAHDLRTPLTVMRGHAELIAAELDNGGDLCEIRDSIREIFGQIERLGAFSDTMGRIQRLEDYEPETGPLPCPKLTEQLAETARLLCPGRDVTVVSALGEAVIETDADALMQICENLLSNASRHARELVTVTLDRDGELARVTVEDDGDGFTKRDLADAAGAYYRGERDGDGTHFGLGLYISSVLAKKLGGIITLENGEGGGARVSVEFSGI